MPTCDLDVITKERLKVSRSTTNEEHFDCLLELRKNTFNIISEGDSWFAYPRSHLFFGAPANIIDNLELLDFYNLLNLSSAGDEAVAMVSGRNKHELQRLLEKYHDDLHFFLFSGGGNDIVGKGDMSRFLIQKTRPDQTWRECIHEAEFEKTIAAIDAAYRDLIALVEKTPKCIILTHSYAYPIPSNVGGAFLGGAVTTTSWIKIYMEEKNISAPDDQFAIITYMMDRFYDTLNELAKQHPRFKLLDIRTTMSEQDWLNEIHLTPSAYLKVARLFQKTMLSLV